MNSRHYGFGLIGWIVTIPLVLVGLLIVVFGFYEGRKAYWDAQIQEMCAKDGGAKVFEIVELDESEYATLVNKFGQLSPPLESRAAKDSLIVHRNTSSFVRQSGPEVRRDELAVVRRSDSKLLGVRISYSRVGGDLFAFHPSHFSCPSSMDNFFSAIVRLRKEQK